MVETQTRVGTSIAPWLSVADGARAVAFYSRALGAVAVDRLEGEGGRVEVAQLRLAGAMFWVQHDEENAPSEGGPRPVRLVLSVDDPDAWFARAVGAGATVVAAVHDAHGWRTGRVRDPFGHDWEFARKLAG